MNGNYSVTPILANTLFTPGTQSVSLTGSGATGVNFIGQVCNCLSFWAPSVTPTEIDSNDGTPIEVGVKFQVTEPGYVAGVKFYKAATNIGTHIGHIWSSTGTLLGSATFTGESASGWQEVDFATPIQVTPNTTYVASYYAPVGHYSADVNYFATTGVTNGPLQAMQNTSTSPDGIYSYAASSTFPSSTYSSTNYWVDVLYTPATSFNLSGTITGGAGATVTLVGSNLAPVTADSSGNYTFTQVFSGSYSVVPTSAGLVFSPGNQNVTVSSSSLTGINFTIPQICPCDTIWTPVTLPTTVDSNDALPYELGVKFRAAADGYIVGVRFYKAATNTGAHIGNLWSEANPASPLASAQFTDETSSGWQQVLFNSPIPVSGNTTYIGSYFAPSGHYSLSTQYFTTAVNSPPLEALASGTNGSNGVYLNSSTSAYPNNSYENDNYWVDVIYAPTTTNSIGGVVSGSDFAGVTMTLSGAASATTTTDAHGNYSFNGLANGTYTVTASAAGFNFTPPTQTISVNSAHQLNIDFVSGLPTYAVSGTVTAGPGIVVNLTGTVAANASTLTLTATADSSGNYSFPSVPNGIYTIAPLNQWICINAGQPASHGKWGSRERCQLQRKRPLLFGQRDHDWWCRRSSNPLRRHCDKHNCGQLRQLFFCYCICRNLHYHPGSLRSCVQSG